MQQIKVHCNKGWPDNHTLNDNGLQFDNTDISHFAKEWKFKHTRNSPKFLQQSSEVEREVRTMKNLLTKENDPDKGLLWP